MAHCVLLLPLTTGMPSSLEIVVASDSGVEPIGKFPPDLNVSYFHHMPTSSAHVKEPLGTYAGPRETREAGVFTRYISDRYDSLPDAVVFVHADIGAHNPVWLRWLYCLRRDVEFASLSPVIVNAMPRRSSEFLNVMNNGSAVTTDGRISHYPARPGDRGHPHCCFLVVLSRRAILRHPRIVYEEADRALTAGKVNAFNFELQYHLLFQPERHEWRNARDVCATFQCERPACATKFIRFVTERGPLASGHSKKHVPVALLDWEDGSCGVQDLTQPEWRTVVPTVRERLELPCASMARDDKALCREGAMSEQNEFKLVLPGYSAYIRRGCSHGDPRCSEEATYASHNITAKTVARSAGCAIIRCWLECCAACASRSWCVAWEWHMGRKGICHLSAQPPGRARVPSHTSVVGVPMPPLEQELRDFGIADTTALPPLWHT